MTVTFGSTGGGVKGLASHEVKGKQHIFKSGLYKTEDKEEIKDIMGSEIYRRNEIVLLDDPAAVADYLDGKEPDRFTEAILDGLPHNIIQRLGRLYNTREQKHATLIKAELIGSYINTKASQILDELNDVSEVETSEDETLLDTAVSLGVLIKAGPWYKTPDETFKTRNRDEVEDWCITNINQIEKAKTENKG
jgi:hypothetical protein